MKKLIIFLFIFVAVGLNAKIFKDFTFGTSFSARSSQAGDIFDYEIAIEFEKPNFLYLEVEKERENGQEFYNHEFKLTHKRSFFIANGKWLNIESNDIDLKQIDLRAVYSKYSLGVAQQWNDDIPYTKLIAGIKYDARLFVFNFLLNQEFLTQDFKDWNTETICKIDLDIYFFKVYWKSKIFNYGVLDWSTKFGISVRL